MASLSHFHAATSVALSPTSFSASSVLPEKLQIGEQYRSKMAVKLRLARLGCRNRPFYRVMAADSNCRRDGKHLEVLGYYDPLPGKDGKRMGLNFERVKYWLSVGAQPSEPVQRILFRAGLLPPSPMLAMDWKGGPRDTRAVDPLSAQEVNSK